ncbi:MAG TPA: hypothetical protein ENJ95_17940 [Bacteroidetes bacterium]|nr:hypothetical protein [Bacteroidota bacterium]
MEKMTNYKEIDPNYGELAKALSSLQLKNKSRGKNFVFVDKQGEVMVLLPLKNENEKVNKARFVSVSYNLADLGIIDHPHDLGKMIEQMRLAEKQVAA